MFERAVHLFQLKLTRMVSLERFLGSPKSESIPKVIDIVKKLFMLKQMILKIWLISSTLQAITKVKQFHTSNIYIFII